MSQRGPQPQEDEGCLFNLLKLILGIAILIGGWWAVYWGVNHGPEFIANLREEGPAWAERTTTTGTSDASEKGDDSQHSGNASEREESSQRAASTSKIVPSNLDKMENADWLRSRYGGTYKEIKDLGWVKDGLTQEEAKATQDLLYMAVNDHETLERVLALQWIEDGITPPEAKAIRHLMYLSYRDKEMSRKVVAMQFLGSVTEEDALLVAGLHGRWHRSTLASFMRHGTVADGVTDEEVIRAAAATTIDHEGHLDRILNPGSATVETIQTASPRTDNLNISIVRAGSRRATNTSLVVEEAVEYVENLMNMPLPTNHVILLLDDTGVTPGFAGVNYGQAIAYVRKGEDGDEWERAAFRKGMVHEVAHYFWRGSEDWIDEGVADTIEHAYGTDAGLPSQIMTTEMRGCTVATLQALSNLTPEQQSKQFQCNYYLGEKLFLDLLKALGREEFSERLRTLYQVSSDLHEDDKKAGIDEVRKVFGDQEGIVAKHWTDGGPEAATARGPGPTLPPRSVPAASTPAMDLRTVPAPRDTEPTPLPTTALVVRMPKGTITPASLAATITPDSTPLPIPVRAPAATVSPASPSPVSTPIRTSAPKPTPSPTQAPTPIPAPELDLFDNSAWKEYTVIYPKGWTVIPSLERAIFTSPDGRQSMEIGRHLIQFHESVNDLAEAHREGVFEQAPGWDHFVEKSAKGEFLPAGHAVIITFDRRKTPEDCTEDGITHLIRSKLFPERSMGYSITMTVCQEDLAAWERTREAMMGSFTEQ